MSFIQAIIKPSYWITHQHPVPEQWQLALTIFFGIILVIGLVTLFLSMRRQYRKPYRTLFTRLSTWTWTMGLLGFALLFFSVQQVAYVSARMFYLGWLALAVLWAYYIVRYALKDVPRLIEGQEERERKEKYLPRKKK